ncbi:PREPL [Symbiodinium pilosum]|uniref:Prolyl endopeptidase n=1 Tax=Symbiodinium pilosum TaxID=2952 RepID=A0A812QPR4_SYMPI|nr:PREPL [Symbiodinium pilosum]
MAHVRRVVREAWRSVRQAQAAQVLSSFFRSSRVSDEWSHLQLEKEPRPTTRRLSEAEKEAANVFFSTAAHFRGRLEAEAASLLVPDNITAEHQGSYTYYQRHNAEGFLLFCRKYSEPSDRQVEEVLLDTGQLAAEGTNYADVTACKVSDDETMLAYIVDLHGDDSFELRVRSLRSDCESATEARIPNIRSVEFLECAHEHSLLAVEVDPESKRACRAVHLTVSPTAACSRRKLWEEEDAAAYLELYRTKDRLHIFVSSNTKETSDVRVCKCGGSCETLSLKPLLVKIAGVEYFAEHQDGWFYIISNHERPDFKVYRASADELDSTNGAWACLQPFFTPPGRMHVTDADLFSRWLVLYGHQSAAPEVCVVPLVANHGSGKEVQPYLVDLPSQIGSVEPCTNADSNVEKVRYTFRSPIEPGCTYELDLVERRAEIVSQCRIDNPELLQSMQCDRLQFPSRDGTLVPLTLVRHVESDQGQDGQGAPCLLQVYGSYGTFLAPDFCSEHVALLRRGWVLAWAHVRGGGENGRNWHSAGRQLSKANSIMDLADAVKFLLSRGIARPGGVCLKGSSAGGLTVGAMLNSRSDAALVSAAILEVPFVDALTSMMDPTLPLTVHEFDEWGDPATAEHAANIRSISPYENLGSHCYPSVYISCASNDARAPAWMSLKYAARLRARSPGLLELRSRRRPAGDATKAGNVVLHCSDSGHAGAMGWQERSEEFSRQVTFLHDALGLSKI